jgi:hypothetical protein
VATDPLDAAHYIAAAFADYNSEFRAITQRAPHRFEARDWRGSQKDVVERIELYDRFVNATIAQLRLRLGDEVLDRALWREIRRPRSSSRSPTPSSTRRSSAPSRGACSAPWAWPPISNSSRSISTRSAASPRTW